MEDIYRGYGFGRLDPFGGIGGGFGLSCSTRQTQLRAFGPFHIRLTQVLDIGGAGQS